MAAHFGSALHSAVAADRHQAGVLASDVSLGELQVDDGAHVLAAIGVLGDAHAPDDDGVARLAEGFGESQHVRRVRPELLSSVSQERLRTLASVSLQPLVRRLMKSRSIQSHSMRCLSTPEKKAMSPPA